MKIIFHSILSFFVFLSFNSDAAFTKIWDYRYGGDYIEYSKKIYETLDHGFLVCGSSYSNISFDKSDTSRGQADYWVVRTDFAGNILWEKTYGGADIENLTCAIVLPDSGFIIGGSSWSGISGDKTQFNHDVSRTTSDFWIVKIDKYGNKVWDKDFGGNKNDALESIVATTDGCFLLAGITYSNNNGHMTHPLYGLSDYWVVKIDSIGNVLWNANYGGTLSEYLTTLNTTSDKGFVLGGRSLSDAGPSKTQNSINGSSDYWIVKIDSNGTRVWDKTLGGDGIEYLNCLLVLPGDNLLVGGISYSGVGFDKSVPNHGNSPTDFWFIKTDNNGVKIWDKVYGGDGNEDELYNVTAINNGYLITGTSYSNISGDKSENNILNIEQSWALAIDTTGNRIWDKTLQSVTHIELCTGFQVFDGCFIFLSEVADAGGDVSQVRGSGQDYWVGKYCIDNFPSAAFAASIDTFCHNTCVNFTNVSSNATTYQWFFPGGSPSTSTLTNPQGICYTTGGTYDVTLVATNTSGTDTMILHNYLTVHAPPISSTITQNFDTLFANTGYTLYQWYYNSTLIPGATNYYYVFQNSGDYSVVFRDNNGCMDTTYVTDVINSIGDVITKDFIINVFTFSGEIFITANVLQKSEINMHLVNSLGEIVLENEFVLQNGMNKFSLNAEKLSTGIYCIIIQEDKQVYFKRVFIE